MTHDLNRRAAIGVALAAGAVLAAGDAFAQQAGTKAPASYQPRPPPFDPKTIAGLSEKLLVSHHDNNYAGAVKRLGAIEGELAKVDYATAPGFLINGLKREELMALNSMILHEVYFAGLAGDAVSPGAKLGARIEKDFGSLDRWRAEFTGMGKALGGGSGWVLLTWSPRRGRLFNAWSSDHTLTPADGSVLVALDMYEHAYHMDFGSNAGAYVDASMKALRWSGADAAFAAAGVPA